MNRQEKYSYRWWKGLLALPLCLLASQTGQAAQFDWGEIHGEYTLTGNYAAAWRLEEPADRIINAPGDPDLPVAEDLKYPQSNNMDDGDRNFDKHDLVNHRLTLIGDLQLSWRDYGLLLRADTFYDDVYAKNHGNAHTAPDRINTTQQPFNSFTDAADKFSGQRTRLLDAYIYGNFYFGDTMALNVRLGKHISAWGQSLFFNGVALSQSTADATRATIPGEDVKSILLPTNQLSLRFQLTSKIILLGQYQFDFEPFLVNPVGEFYSAADVVGPGREFIYGFRNPFDLDQLARFTLTDVNDIADVLFTIDSVFDDQLPTEQLEDILRALPLGLPPISLPTEGQNPLGAPSGVNPQYIGDIEPDKRDKQYGFGLQYRLTDVTELGAYYLNYHQKTPAVQTNPGKLTLIPSQELAPGVALPEITTAELGLVVPATYNVRYFDNVDLFALSFSTLLFGWNVGGEIIRREGADVLIDVNQGVNGDVPTPTRANINQVLINAIYTFRPSHFFESIVLVGEVGWIQAEDVEPQFSYEGAQAGQPFDKLTFDEEAYAVAFLSFLEKRNIFPGWDLRIPISLQRAIRGRTPLAGAFGSLFHERDTRVGVGFEFTRLNKLTLGINYSGFTGGDPHFLERPLADRDTVGVNAKYSFF
ncbi:MAG: DUF1302 domain-containing protein [Nevskiales bacterium]